MGNKSSTRSQQEIIQELLCGISTKLMEWIELVNNMQGSDKHWIKTAGVGYLKIALVDEMEKCLIRLKAEIEACLKGQQSTKSADGTGEDKVEDTKRLQSECSELKSQVQKITKDKTEKNQELDKCRQQKRNLEEQLNRLSTENGDLKQEIQNANNRQRKTEDALQKQKNESERLRTELEKEKHANKEALTRLSEFASNRLLLDNPAIADLSDPFRPTNISQMYMQLYDDEWTTAYGTLTDNGKPERENIEMLKHILLESMTYCQEAFKKQKQSIEQALKMPKTKDSVLVKVSNAVQTDSTEKGRSLKQYPDVEAMQNQNGQGQREPDETNGNGRTNTEEKLEATSRKSSDQHNTSAGKNKSQLAEERTCRYTEKNPVQEKTECAATSTVGGSSSQISSKENASNVDTHEVIDVTNTVADQPNTSNNTSLKYTSVVPSMNIKMQSLYPEVKQGVQNVVKKSATKFISELQKDFLLRLDSTEFPEGKEIVSYVEKCVSVCWLMVIQTPSMVLVQHNEGDKLFKKDLYKNYTKTGKTIDFIVWPPLMLHKDEAIMCKGIAQCTG